MNRELKRDLKHAIIDLEYQRCHDGVEAIENAIEYIEDIETKLEKQNEEWQETVTIGDEIVAYKFMKFLESINLKYERAINPVGNYTNVFISGTGVVMRKAVYSAIELFKSIDKYFYGLGHKDEKSGQ